MSNVFCIAWRNPCPGLRASGLLPSSPATTLRPVWSIPHHLRNSTPCWRPYSISRRIWTVNPLLSVVSRLTPPQTSSSSISVPFRSFWNKPSSEPEQPPPFEDGVPVDAQPLSAAQIKAIFGRSKISPELGNRIIAVLHGRRLAGTLDLDLPADIASSVREPSINAALEWLREKYPIDEDAAILDRIEREEQEAEQKLMRRAQSLGLFKPQSGSFGAELGEGKSVYGKSVLDEMRQENEARLLAKQEKERQEWLEGEAKDLEKRKRQFAKVKALQVFEESAVVEARPRADPVQRPVLAWIQKYHLQATNDDFDPSKITTARRLLPSLAVTLITLGLCYVLAQNYEAPVNSDRLWPDVSPATATIMTLIGINFCIFALWKFPPAWRMLNRYFVSSVASPHPFSIIGANFSHVSIRHFAFSMALLWAMGTKLHEEIGRGNFLALYFGLCACSSMVSLTTHVLTGQLAITSLGSSGPVLGLVFAWLMHHRYESVTLPLPGELSKLVVAPAWIYLSGMIAFEVFNLVFPVKFLRVDWFAHSGALLAGLLWGATFKSGQEMKHQEEHETER